MISHLPSRLAVRLLLFNILLVFLPVAGLFSVRSLEQQLLDLQERSMVQQGRLVAAAMAEETELSEQRARSLIQRLGGRSEARIRIVDARERVLADSAVMHVRGEHRDRSPEAAPASRKNPLYRVGASLWRPLELVLESLSGKSQSSRSRQGDDVTPRTVVRRALEGRYAATLQESPGQRSLTLYSVLPVRAGGAGEVVGAVVVSQSTSRILRALWRVRLDIFRVFVISVVVAAVLSLLVSATIARPLIRLRDEAGDLLDHRGRLRKTFRGSHRKDEIGDLTRALEKLTARLERHLTFVESFSADVSHEFKNPLAAIRSASELLEQTDDEQERRELGATIDREVGRLNRLLNGVREISRIDAALDTEKVESVEMRSLLSGLPQAQAAVASGRVRIELSIPSVPIAVSASADRLIQAFGNILDNAISFSPPGGRVAVQLQEHDGQAMVLIDDEGPGIPPEHFERVFERFFSFRPDSAGQKRQHDGLGLAIARAIIDSYGGGIQATKAPGGGARIEVRLPVARA